MRVYSATQTLFYVEDSGDLVVAGLLEEGQVVYRERYFRSHTEARKWGNSMIKLFVAYHRKFDAKFKLADIGWEAVIVIKACDFAKTGKDTLLALLNGEGDYFVDVQTIETWTPETKWTKVEVGDGDTLRS
jgi:hypothetical protein